MPFTVIFQPSGRRGQLEAGVSLLEAARLLGVEVESACGGAGTCGKCRVRVENGLFPKLGIVSRPDHLSPLTQVEKDTLSVQELEANYRLACQARLQGDVLVYLPEQSRTGRQVILETGRQRAFSVNPAVRKYYLEVPPATLKDARDDLRRVLAGLKASYGFSSDLEIDWVALGRLPGVLREGDWKLTVTVWMDREIIHVEPGRREEAYGVAVDVGTTTLAAYLCDLQRGLTVARKSAMNPQVRYGEDILSRVTYAAGNPQGLEEMQQAVVGAINQLITELAAEAGLSAEDVLDIVLVGNTVMHHILCRLDPRFVGRAPFAPVVADPLDLRARDLGLRIAPGARVHLLPLEAGFVGADNVAVLLAEAPYDQEEEVWLIIDIGTNGEVVLGNRRRLLCTSCATGPALEGAQIRFGMRAAPGAIERVRIDPRTYEVSYKVIGLEDWYPAVTRTGARGICGSGIVEAVAEMFRVGLLLPDGRINRKAPTRRVRLGGDDQPEFVLAWAEETALEQDITVTQKDVRAVQLAKAALYVGARLLMKKLGIEQVDRIILAGAFGTYLDRERALMIGMIPDCDPERVQAVGNAAGDGAQIALFDRNKRLEAARVARQVEFVETAAEPDFQKQFLAAMAFPHAYEEFPHVRQMLTTWVTGRSGRRTVS
ncbi:MAG: ASKHA domain-containing protein [Moorellales bacterium]